MAIFPTPPWLTVESEPTRPDYLSWIATAMACMALYIDTFQVTMVNFGLQAITEALDFNPFDINWVIIAYSITFATLLPISGVIADRYGLRFGFVVGNITLTGASALCAAAPNKNALIVGRALCGIGASMCTATGPPIVSHLFKDEKTRNKALALLIMCGPLGMVSGMIFGALLVESPTGWPAMFWLALAVNGFLGLVGFLTIPEFADISKNALKKFDFIGLGIFVCGLPLLIYGVNLGELQGWATAEILGPLIIGGLLLIAFPFYERRLENPLVPKPFLCDGNMMLMLLNFVIFGGGFATWLFLVTQVFLQSFHITALKSAIYLLPAAIGSIFSGALGSFLSTRIPARFQIGGAYVWTAAFTIPWALITLNVAPAYIYLFALLYLFGNAPAVVRAQGVTLSTIPLAQHGQATAMLMVSYQAGSAIMLALANAVADTAAEEAAGQEGLLKGYKAAFWLVLGITLLACLVFLVCYRERNGTPSQESPSGSEYEAPKERIGTSSGEQSINDDKEEARTEEV